ncbi:MAG: hypothetical protein JWQ14_1067 [Adhaeribacter sp.]|nr:hypothetical protein [Adhaeribacter sp.]
MISVRKVQMNEVHDGPGCTTAQTLHPGQQFAQTQRWSLVKEIGRQKE